MMKQICLIEEELNSIVKRLRAIYIDCPEKTLDKFLTLFSGVLDFNDLTTIKNDFFGFCPLSNEIKIHDKVIKLSRLQGRLFYRLALNLESFINKEILYNFLYNNNPEKEVNMNIVDVMVSQINKLIIPHQMKIKNSWGCGYGLVHSIPKLYVTNPNYKITINGETKEIRQFLKEADIKYNVFWARVKGMGWDTYKSILTPRRHNRKENRVLNRIFTFNGQTKTIGEWVKDLNMNRVTVRYRINVLKWPVEKAIFTEEHNNHGRNRRLHGQESGEG